MAMNSHDASSADIRIKRINIGNEISLINFSDIL